MPRVPEDHLGNASRIAQANVHTGAVTWTGFTYDTFGDLVEVIDQDGNIRHISYNENGEQVGTQFHYYSTDQRPPTQSQLNNPNVTLTAADYPSTRTLTANRKRHQLRRRRHGFSNLRHRANA